MSFHIISKDTKDITPEVLDENGKFRIPSSSYWHSTKREERSLFAVKNAMYVLPSTELIEKLRNLIGGRSVIEIGAGNGVLSEALGIRATDNHMQSWPGIQKMYSSMGQPTITYGSNVEELNAAQAIYKYKPQVVLAAWVTHKYDILRHSAGGNAFGVEEDEILDSVDTYIFIGNRHVHAGKKIWNRYHKIEYPDFLFSRAMNNSPDFIAVWNKENR